MMRRVLLSAALIGLSLGLVAGNAEAGAPQPSFPIRAAFYYPWYPSTWTVNGSHVFYTPTLGYYDSSDRAVQQAHIRALDSAGMDAAISSWWGAQHRRDTRFAELLAQTESLGSSLKWTIYHELEGKGDLTPAEIGRDLTHLQGHAQSAAFLRVDGRFVVFVYNVGDDCDVADRWEQANASLGEPAYIVLKLFSGFRDCPTQPDSWHQYAPLEAVQHHTGYSYAISPGFWRADKSAAGLERDLPRWQRDVRNMVASGEPWQLVTTFNEWGEGTAVERADDWGNSYLNALAEAPTPPPTSPPPAPLVDGRPSSPHPAPARRSFRLGVLKFKGTNGVVARVSCRASGQSPCRGKLTLTGRVKQTLLRRVAAAGNHAAPRRRVVLAKKRIVVKAGQAKTIKTRLNATGRRLTARLTARQLRGIRITVKAILRDTGGQRHTSSKTLRFPR